MKDNKQPRTLQEAIRFYANPDNALAYMVRLRWPDGKVTCPTCGRTDVVFLKNQRKWQCKSVHAKRQFSAKVGTIFEDSPIPLDKWITAVWMLTNCRNGVSSYEVARAVGVIQKSAWFMLHRIRLGLQTNSKLKLGGGGGEVEADETFIGGKARNMHKSVRDRRIQGKGFNVEDKTTVMGILERGGQVRAHVVPDRKKETLQPLVKGHVLAGVALFTDELTGYQGLSGEYEHQIVDHATRYVDGKVHTNGMENFWSLLKRGLGGTYVSVEPFHLFRYLDEQVFRYNHRKYDRKRPIPDAKRFDLAMGNISSPMPNSLARSEKRNRSKPFHRLKRGPKRKSS